MKQYEKPSADIVYINSEDIAMAPPSEQHTSPLIGCGEIVNV